MFIVWGIYIIGMYLYSWTRYGKRYWSIRKKERVNGKPTVVMNKYIGTDQQLIEKLLSGEINRLDGIEVESYSFGGIAAFLAADQELGLTSVIADVTGSLATALASLAFIEGRSEEPVSKNGMDEWYSTSILQHLIPKMPSLSCRSYLYHMDKLTDENVREITFRLAKRMIELGHVPSLVFLDTTNFSTEQQPSQDDPARLLPRAGHPKSGDFQAKLVGLATAVSEQLLPVFHEVYPGNKNDAELFQEIIDSMVDCLLKLGIASEDLVFVFDKGVNSEDGWKALTGKQVHFVSSLKRNQVQDLLARPIKSYKKLLTTEQDEEISAFRVKRTVMGIAGSVVVTYNESSRKKQTADYEKAKERFLSECRDIAEKMSKPHRGKKSTIQSVTERIEDVLPKKWRGVFKYHVGSTLDDGFTEFAIKSWVEKKKEQEIQLGFGKTIIFTDRTDWDDEKIARTYLARSAMEGDYHVLKDVLLMPVMPIFHQLDPRIKVHGFLCVMGLLFYRWIQLRIQEKLKEKIPIDRLARVLKGISAVSLIDTRAKKVKYVLERMGPEESRLVTALDLGRFLPK
jgi:transposase